MTHATTQDRRSRGQVLASGLGQTLLTVGLVLLLFCAYELEVTGLRTAREQTGLGDTLARSWAATPPPVAPVAAGRKRRPERALPALGSALARVYAPRLGRDWSWVVVEGVSPADLQKGPGHYPGTALPGEIGNTVISGHRTTYGAPFNDLLDLRDGDAVVVETRDGVGDLPGDRPPGRRAERRRGHPPGAGPPGRGAHRAAADAHHLPPGVLRARAPGRARRAGVRGRQARPPAGSPVREALMYVWFWRALPGPLPVRLLLALLALALVVTALMLVVFPAVEPLVPVGDVTVDGAG